MAFPANSMYACHRGEILGEVQARVLASKGKTGASLVIQTMQDPRITEAGRLLAQKLELSGFFGLDFILKSETNEPVLIELNPRSTKLGPYPLSPAALTWPGISVLGGSQASRRRLAHRA